jgi:hypothetical protein
MNYLGNVVLIMMSPSLVITGARVGGHVANPTNTTNSSALEFALSFLCAASDEQYESIPDDEEVSHVAQIPQGEDEVS